MDNCTPQNPVKKCTKCKQELPLIDEFWYRNKRYKCGYHSWCKQCTKTYCRDYAHQPEVVIRRHEYNRLPEVVEKRRVTQQSPEYKEYQKRYGRTEKRKTYIAQWRRCNSKLCRSYSAKWSKANPLKVRAHSSLRRARKYQAIGKYTQADVDLQYRSQRGKCWWCGKKLKSNYQADHIIPLSRGGSNLPENIVISCAFCNQSKHNKLPQEWNGRLF